MKRRYGTPTAQTVDKVIVAAKNGMSVAQIFKTGICSMGATLAVKRSHPTIAKMLDENAKARMAYDASRPSGLSADEAERFITAVTINGKTIPDLTRVASADYLCSINRWQAHRRLNPGWWTDEVARANVDNASRKKSENAHNRGKYHDYCARGIHRMEGDNVAITGSFNTRCCRACRDDANRRPLSVDEINAVKAALEAGRKDYTRVITNPSRLTFERKRNPDLVIFIESKVIAIRAQAKAVRFRRANIQKIRDQENDYHTIRAMIPETNPHRGDIVARIFEDILSGRLARQDVRARVNEYVRELNRENPTRYRKFGDSLLYSLDAAVFEDGAATRHDYVSESLWEHA